MAALAPLFRLLCVVLLFCAALGEALAPDESVPRLEYAPSDSVKDSPALGVPRLEYGPSDSAKDSPALGVPRLGHRSIGSVQDVLLRADSESDGKRNDGSYRPPTTSYIIVCNGETCTETARFVYDPTSASWMPMSAPWLMLPSGVAAPPPVSRVFGEWQWTVQILVVFSAAAFSLLVFLRYRSRTMRLERVREAVGVGSAEQVRRVEDGAQATSGEASKSAGSSVSSLVVKPYSPPHMETAGDGQSEYMRVGRLLVSQKVLGYGSMGTVVLEGLTEDGRRVAVKRMLSTFYLVAHAEIALLCESDDHPSVVRYHSKEDDGDFFYLALELCEKSLSEAVDAGTRFPLPVARRLMWELLSGVSHLHSLKIVHRDLKPQNVLLSSSAPVHLKISDMGVAKKLENDRLSFSTQSFGSQGWQAPEVLVGGRLTEKVDIFAAGCLVFYILSGGRHLFGDRYERELNIVKGTPLGLVGAQSASERASASVETLLPDSGVLLPEARDLISQMVDPSPDKRPSAEQCCNHPFFWSSGRRLMFLQELSDFVEFAQSSAIDAIASSAVEVGVLRDDYRAGMSTVAQKLVDALEAQAGALYGKNGDCDWKLSLDAELLADLNRFRRGGYNGRSVCDLLRVVRNKSRHFRQLPNKLQVCFEGSPAGLLSYFLTRFPLLLVCTFRVTYLVLHDDRLPSQTSDEQISGCSAVGDLEALDAILSRPNAVDDPYR